MAARLREPVGPHLEGAEFIRFLGAGGFADVFFTAKTCLGVKLRLK